MLVALGAHIIQADHINPDGTVNRPKLAEAAFTPDAGGATRIADLNAIVHPAVIRHENEWMESESRRDPCIIVIVEAALILEAGAADRFDRLIVVTCTEDQRVRRFAERMKIDFETARREVAHRMAAQLPDSEKIKRADYVIDNSGSLDATEDQVRRLYVTLKQQAERSPA
jgi:dephospho-CoA kinase